MNHANTYMAMEIEQDVVIVGAGVAGLATAVGLMRVGVRCLVLEKSKVLRTTGAAFTLTPNAWRALDALGVSHKLDTMYTPLLKTSVTTVSNGNVQELPIGKPGNGPRTVHRSVLQDVLAGELPMDIIRFSSKLKSIKIVQHEGSTLAGRPTRKDEQKCGRKPSFSVSTSEYEAPPNPKTQKRNTRLVREFPQLYQRYISRCVDVQGDGHCGFRAITLELHGSKDAWVQVRLNLIQEIRDNFAMYDGLYFQEGWALTLLDRLNCFEEPAPMLSWMDVVQMGVIIASTYNIVLHTFDVDPVGCYTHLPLRSVPVPVAQRRHIAIRRVHNSHFVQLILSPHYPVPPVIIWRLSCMYSNEWANPYAARIQLWYEVMEIAPLGLHFGGNLD